MGDPVPQERQGNLLGAPLPADGPRRPEGDATPGVVLAARILLWIQGGLGALAVLLLVSALVVLLVMWDSLTGRSGDTLGLADALAGVGVLVLIIVVGAGVLVLGTIIVGLTIPTFILATRFGSRRNGVRVGTLVLEAIVGVLLLFAGVWSVVENGIAVGVVCLLTAALSWTVFGLLMGPRAASFFRA